MSNLVFIKCGLFSIPNEFEKDIWIKRMQKISNAEKHIHHICTVECKNKVKKFNQKEKNASNKQEFFTRQINLVDSKQTLEEVHLK